MSRGQASRRRVLMIVENLPVPFDRRVWQEATTLRDHGYEVSVISPKGRGYTRGHETIDGIAVYRHPLPFEATHWYGYLVEYGLALAFQFALAWRVWFTRGFDVIHACNPPDTIFLVASVFKILARRRFIFDHHDLSPELYAAKRGRAGGVLHRVLLRLERMTYRLADVAIVTNESYRKVALTRGGMTPDRVFVVRSGPDLTRLAPRPPNEAVRNGRRYLVAYVGIMGLQDGVALLLEAIRHVVHDRGRDDVQFALVGGGTEFDRVAGLVRSLRLEEHVTLTGLLPPYSDLLLDILATADVGVSPDPPNAMNDKSTMNKTLEYMAFGKPVVQFDLTEGRVSAGEASLYASGEDPHDLGDRIVELLDDEAMRTYRGRLGRDRIERVLSWEHQQPVLLKAYERAWASRGLGRAMPESRRDPL